jgi:dynein heavy chain
LLCFSAGKEVEETLRIVDAQTQEAAAKKQVVEGEEAIASEKAAAAKAIKVRVLSCSTPIS